MRGRGPGPHVLLAFTPDLESGPRVKPDAPRLLLALLFAAACNGGSERSQPARDLATTLDAATGGDWTETPYLTTSATTHSFVSADPVTTPGVDYAARIVTSAGTLVVDLTEAQTPITVNSFVFLARHHFFEGIAFHRVIEDFMAQSGDPNTIEGAPSSWGYGGPGYEFVNEIDSSLTFADAGVLAMANSGADTNGSQFFLTFGAAPFLDGDYTIFGRVIEGASVLGTIARGEPPASPTRITSVQILQR